MHYGIITKDEPIVCPVDEVGNFTAEVPDFANTNVKVRRRFALGDASITMGCADLC